MSQLTLKNLIKRKWLSVIIISYLFFLVVKSGGDNFICVKVTLLSLAVLLTHYSWLSFSLLIISVLMNLLKGNYLLTIFILFFLIMFRVALYKKVKGIRWLILIYWSALILMWTGTIVIFYWGETFFKFLPYNQIGPEPFGLSMSFEQSEASSFKLAPEVWARPSWIYSVGALSIVEGFAQTPFENMTHLLEVKGLTTGFPSRASLAQVEIDPLISKLESTGLFPFKPSVIENFRDLLKDWHCEPLLFLSNFFEAHLSKLALVEEKFQSIGLYQKKLFGLHLYNDWLVLTTYDECTRIGINSMTPMGPFNTSQLTDIKVFGSNIKLMFGERQIEIALSNLRETKALGLQELWDNSPPEPFAFDNPNFVHGDLNLHKGPRGLG
uniref:Uncharacterized protein n=1 Tax=Anemonia manjano TaxID=105399 RepID=A0A2L0WQX9_ANEMA|nr:hypothetical protein C7V53_mgp13 [Anemonia manjano]AVA29791.1 hypothetical protein [Anemonia manjano]